MSGTHCQINSEIRRVMSTDSNSSLKQSCSALTSVTSALEVIFNVMRSINPRFTYLLIYVRKKGGCLFYRNTAYKDSVLTLVAVCVCIVDRYMKCLSCHNKLLAIRSDLERKANQHEGRLRLKMLEMLELCQLVTQR